MENLTHQDVLMFSQDRSVTLGYDIYLADQDIGDFGQLVHEMTRVWQYVKWGAAEYYARGAAERAEELAGGNPYRIDLFTIVRSFQELGMEQQATVVQRCYEGRKDFFVLSPFQRTVRDRNGL